MFGGAELNNRGPAIGGLDQVAIPTQAEINQQIGTMSNNLDILEKSLEMLTGKIMPILGGSRPGNPSKDDVGKAQSSLAQVLQLYNARISHLIAGVGEVISRVEL